MLSIVGSSVMLSRFRVGLGDSTDVFSNVGDSVKVNFVVSLFGYVVMLKFKVRDDVPKLVGTLDCVNEFIEEL